MATIKKEINVNGSMTKTKQAVRGAAHKKKRKICAVTANRADFSRMETALEAIKKNPRLELQLVVFGSHLLETAGRTIEEIKRKGFSVDRTFYMEIAGGNLTTMTKSVGLAIIELASVFDALKPDIVLAPSDRFESLAIGVTAALMNIHIAHMQGGEVSGTIDESIRHAMTKMSHLHLVATEKSRERVIKMGELPDTVFNIGCPGSDLLLKTPVMNRKSTLSWLNKNFVKIANKLNPQEPYLFLLQHPVTTEFQDAESQIKEILEAMAGFKEQIIAVWPNIDAGSDNMSVVLRRHPAVKSGKIKIFKHIPTEIFVNVVRNAACFIGNSSSGIRESCYFGTPTVNIGSRQNSRERGSNVIDAGYDRKEIAKAVKAQIAHGVYPVEYIFGDGTAGKHISDICATVNLPNIQKKITY